MDERIHLLARLFIEQAKEPMFSTADTSSAVGVPAGTIRQWINRRHLETDRPGVGRSMLFSTYDLLKVAGFAELSRLGFQPGRFAQDTADMIESGAVKKILELAGFFGPWREDMIPLYRYLVVFWADSSSGLSWSLNNEPAPPGHDPLDRFRPAAWAAVDCWALALRALDALDRKIKEAIGE